MVYSFYGTLYSIKNKPQLHVTPWMHLKNTRSSGKESYRRTEFIYITPNKQKAEQCRFRDRNIYDKTMVKEQENYMTKIHGNTYLSLRKHRWWWQWDMHPRSLKSNGPRTSLERQRCKRLLAFHSLQHYAYFIALVLCDR